MTVVVIIDADPLVYRAGFATESHERHVVWQPEGDEGVEQIIFYPRDGETANQQLKAWVAKYKEEHEGLEPDILENDLVVMPMPVVNAYHIAKEYIRQCRYAVSEHFNVEPDEIKLEVLLSGPDNFREDLATVVPYKGNRDGMIKPVHYQQVRNYFTEFWNAEVIHGREADDECSIRQLRYEQQGTASVLCSIDKDLDMVPGHHYDYVRKKFYHTQKDEGLVLFYKQVLKGDPTDNIPGAAYVGDKAADTIVDTYLLDNPGDWAGLWKHIVEVYDKTLTKYGEKCKYYEKGMKEGAEAVALEMARLVKMQEYEGQLWNPPGIQDGLMLGASDAPFE